MFYRRIFGMPAFSSFQPFEELSRMRRQMDRIMDSLWERPGSAWTAGVFPAINLTEDEQHFYIRTELPGLTAENLDIQATTRNLTITGERKLAVENESARYHRREREGGRFSRAFALPKEVDAERIEAKMENGVLTLKIPKAESAKPRRIAIGK
ncbi:MAG: Hsp20/alpha crystallin family protein [Desulfobacteraceae bacterium]|nr:MAG: Hsp20/alpha crystallin family protein [Desulfobacteraceae bacterium]